MFKSFRSDFSNFSDISKVKIFDAPIFTMFESKMFSFQKEENWQDQVHVFKDVHKNIIGKGGATIRKVRHRITLLKP